MKNPIALILSAVLVLCAGHAGAADTAIKAPVAVPVNANALTGPQIEKFIASMEDVRVLADDMKAEGKTSLLKQRIKPPVPGQEFTPYRTAIATLREEFPPDYVKLGRVTSLHGYGTQEVWAVMGDRIVAAYMASRVPPGAQQSIQTAKASMTPEVLAKMPPAIAAQIRKGLALADQVNAVPAADREAVLPYQKQIDTFINENAHYAE